MTQVGFWRTSQQENRRAILNDYGLINKVWYLFPQGGGPRGSFTTFTDLAPNLRNRDLIYLSGVLLEQATAPLGVFDVTLLGAANRPRQATNAGVATGGGASWLAPASPVATTPLLTLREQGWRIENIQFAPVAASACIRLARAETAAIPDGSHAEIVDCYFVGGGTTGIGIEDVGGCGHVLIDNCRFESIADTAIKGISTGVAVPLAWMIKNCHFISNLNDIKMSLSNSLIEKNRFYAAGSGSTNKVISTIAVSGQGNNNHVILNMFKNTTGEIQISNGYSGGSTDSWSNYCEGTADLIVTSPPGA
jgi:hypothetical protein